MWTNKFTDPIEYIFQWVIIMRKNIKFNIIFPRDEEGKRIVQNNIGQFCNDILVTYINNLNYNYAGKIHILEKISMPHHRSKEEQETQTEK